MKRKKGSERALYCTVYNNHTILSMVLWLERTAGKVKV
jgi:hypothetical protein